MRVRPGPEHARDRSRLRHCVHPRGSRAVRPGRSLGVRQLRRHLSRPERRRRCGGSARTRTCSSTSPADRGSGATSTCASRKAFIDSDPAFTQLAIAKAEPWYVEFFQRFIAPVHLRREHRHPGIAIPTGDFTWHKTWQPVTLDDWRTARRAAQSLFNRDDVADRELHRRRRQQGSGVREVHRPAVAHAAALRAGRSTARRRCCANTGGRRWTRWASRGRCGTIASSSSVEGGVRRREAHLRRHAVGLVQRSHRVLSRLRASRARAGHGLDGAPAARRGPAGLLDSGRGAGRHRPDQQRLRSARARGARDRARTLRRPIACCRVCSRRRS